MTKLLPANLTSYDFLKALAVILMITDHIGYHFYPDETWFRILGRLCVPIWFFLIGYARTRDIPKTMFVGAGILIASSLVAGQYLFPLTILVTLMLARTLIDPIMFRALRSYETLAGMFFVLLLLSYPADFFLEYGTAGILFTMFGYMVRYRPMIKLHKAALVFFTAMAGFIFFLGQGMMLPSVTPAQGLVLLFGVYGVLAMLWCFKPLEFPRLTSVLPRPFTWLIQFFGRQTLEVYVAHLVVFRLAAMAVDSERFGLFQWQVMPENALAFIKAVLSLE
jgi:hypothetical protein